MQKYICQFESIDKKEEKKKEPTSGEKKKLIKPIL